jgi:Arc/MetJ family transcription regulator
MKSIKDTLKITQGIISALPVEVNIALAGGYAVILHGVERTTIDIDFCLYSDFIKSTDIDSASVLRKYLPERFKAKLMEGSKIPDDPFKHDVIFIEDKMRKFLRIDLLIARYKWELEAIKQAETVRGIPVPVLSKPYLAAMKLQSTGLKDASDVVNLLSLMTVREKAKTSELAKRTGRDKKLARLLAPVEEEVHETPEELI